MSIKMEKLPEIRKTVALSLRNPTPGTKAIDLRRQMVELPEVANSLSNVEKYVFAASTKKQVCEMDDQTLVSKTAQLFRFIAMDVGIVIPTDTTEWTYICTRLLDILKKYYSKLTLAEVKLAFELTVTGEMNEYLPRDRFGNPDKAHYNQFNAEYFTKILNAYRTMQNRTISKAFAALPEPKQELTPAQIDYYRKQRISETVGIFMYYKYRGRMPQLSSIQIMLTYDCLAECGLACPVVVSEEDKQAAFGDLMRRAASGMINKYTAYQIRRQGTEHEDTKLTAYWIARRKALQQTLDELIAEEIQITDYLKLEK